MAQMGNLNSGSKDHDCQQIVGMMVTALGDTLSDKIVGNKCHNVFEVEGKCLVEAGV